jgi:hypothetical protein
MFGPRHPERGAEDLLAFGVAQKIPSNCDVADSVYKRENQPKVERIFKVLLLLLDRVLDRRHGLCRFAHVVLYTMGGAVARIVADETAVG